MLPVQDAVKISLTTFLELFPDSEEQDLRLEEVSLTEDGADWLVTVSYKNPDYVEQKEDLNASTSSLGIMLGLKPSSRRRLSKTIKIRSEDGQFIGIKAVWQN